MVAEFGFRLTEIPEVSDQLQKFIDKRHHYLTKSLYSPEAALTGIFRSLLDILGNLKLDFRPSDVDGRDIPEWIIEPFPLLQLLALAENLDDNQRRATKGLTNFAKALQEMSSYDVDAAKALRKACSVTAFFSLQAEK